MFVELVFECGKFVDFGEVCGVVFEVQYVFQVEQLEFGVVQFGQVFLGDCFIVVDYVVCQQLCFGMVEFMQVFYYLLQGVVVGVYVGIMVVFVLVCCFFVDDVEQFVFVGQGQ